MAEKPKAIKCPECDAVLNLDPKVRKGEIVVCKECRVELEVRNINPIKLDLAPKEEEDWGE